MHRHLFELVELNGKPTAGIKKDTVIVPAFGRATVDLVADQPGLTLFHCHIQQHMDFGFKALFRYALKHRSRQASLVLRSVKDIPFC